MSNSVQNFELELHRERFALNSLLEFAQTLRPTLGVQGILKSVVRTIMGKALISDSFAYELGEDGIYRLATRSGFRSVQLPIESATLDQLQATITLTVSNPETGETIAVIGFGRSLLPEAQLESQRTFLDSLRILTGIAISNARLFENEKERQRLESELTLAREIQQSLLPQCFPLVQRSTFAAYNRTSEAIGGDYYDVIKLSNHRVLVAIADVVGKGVSAALTMSNMQAALRALSSLLIQGQLNLVGLVEELNRLMCESTSAERFITAAFAVIDSTEGVLESIVCGHPYPLLVQQDGVQELPTNGIPLGISRSFHFTSSRFSFLAPCFLLMYTDGLSESVTQERMLGTAGVKEIVQGFGAVDSAVSVVEQLVNREDLEINDDFTLLAVSVE